MKQRISILILSFIFLLHLVAFSQPTFEVLPVSGDTTYQVQTTIKNNDNSESVTLTPPYDSLGVRNFIDTQIARNSRQTARKVNELKDLNAENGRLKTLFNAWNADNYFKETQEKYKDLFVGTWRLRYDNSNTIMTIDDRRRVNEFGEDRTGVLIIDSRELIVLRNYMDADVDVKLYKESEDIFVGEYNDKKIFIKKVSDKIRKEEK